MERDSDNRTLSGGAIKIAVPTDKITGISSEKLHQSVAWMLPSRLVYSRELGVLKFW